MAAKWQVDREAFMGADTEAAPHPRNCSFPPPPSQRSPALRAAEGALLTESYSITKCLERDRCAISSPLTSDELRLGAAGGGRSSPVHPQRC